MKDYWVDFASGPSCYVPAATKEEAKALAEERIGPVTQVRCLPYPAMPQPLGGSPSGCPAFCYRPRECAGRTSCPRNPSCSE